MEAVAGHELEISEERLGIRVLVMVQFLLHRREIHDLWVRWNIQRNPVCVEKKLGGPFISQ